MLPRSFYHRSTTTVARDLLGKILVHEQNGGRIAGMIIETEAYVGETDLACHAKAGRTKRTAQMYGQPGFAYVYFTYGMHWLFNCVTEDEGFPAAVLVRGVKPLDGIDIIAARRKPIARPQWTNGPGKLCKAFGIHGAHHGTDLCAPNSNLFIEDNDPISDFSVTTSPRVGLNTVPEPWKSMPWRWLVTSNIAR